MNTPKTLSRYLLLGSNITKSISPAIQNKAFEKTGFNASYELFQITENNFDSSIREIQNAKDVKGFNLTAPYKETIIPYLSQQDARSKSIGAVNTVKIGYNGKMRGFNTDVDGILVSLSKVGALKKGGRCVLLGAGGAARACAYTVLKNGYESIVILNRSKDRAEKLRSDFRKQFPKARILVRSLTSEQFTKEIKNSDLLINAVTTPFPIEADFSGVKKNLKFFDLGYKEPSSILTCAIKSKVKSIDGILMLVEQGARAFEIWTGMEAPRLAMLLAGKRELLKSRS